MAAARRELGARKYFWLSIGMQMSVAYVVTFVVYQVGRLFVG